MFGYELANPGYLLLLVLLVPMIVWYIMREKYSHADLKYSSLQIFKGVNRAGKVWFRHVLFVMKMLALAFLIFALARPQAENKWKTYSNKGIDIVLTLDVSTSMLAQDFTPNRIEAAKKVAKNFILERANDRIGLVIFSGESFTQCPLTTDRAVLVNLMKDVKCGMIKDGTAIGLGLANAVNRLKESKSKSKVVILLTDGVNNGGAIAPETAAELAKTFGIRVYTIGVGSQGTAPYPFQTPFGIQMQDVPVEIDEAMLIKIADLTDGKYFRATNNETLAKIYTEIDKMEKSKIDVKHFSKKDEKFFIFVLIGMLLLVTESLLAFSAFRKIP